MTARFFFQIGSHIVPIDSPKSSMIENMKWNILAVVIAVLVFGGFYFFYPGGASSPDGATQDASNPSVQTQDTTSTATNYDECVAEGGKILPDATDKCLTIDGHIFIQGTVE